MSLMGFLGQVSCAGKIRCVLVTRPEANFEVVARVVL